MAELWSLKTVGTLRKNDYERLARRLTSQINERVVAAISPLGRIDQSGDRGIRVDVLIVYRPNIAHIDIEDSLWGILRWNMHEWLGGIGDDGAAHPVYAPGRRPSNDGLDHHYGVHPVIVDSGQLPDGDRWLVFRFQGDPSGVDRERLLVRPAGLPKTATFAEQASSEINLLKVVRTPADE